MAEHCWRCDYMTPHESRLLEIARAHCRRLPFEAQGCFQRWDSHQLSMAITFGKRHQFDRITLRFFLRQMIRWRRIQRQVERDCAEFEVAA